MPVGIAGPLHVRGEHADGHFYVPLATTEGALVRSYERGMAVMTKSGGAVVRILRDENEISPVFRLSSVAEAPAFCAYLEEQFDQIKAEAEATTSHGQLRTLESRVVGREVMVTFRFTTGDAHGMNMITHATEAASQWIAKHPAVKSHLLFSGLSSEKRPSGRLLSGGKGKTVIAEVEIPDRLLRLYLRTSAEEVCRLWRSTLTGNMAANAIGYCGHYANGLAALFVACGQDVANLPNSAVGVTRFEVSESGGLWASVTLTSLTLATVGGGVDLPTSRTCLEMMGCRGSGKVGKLTEIAAGMVLAGEISFGGALASGEMAQAHEKYGRNRPDAETKP